MLMTYASGDRILNRFLGKFSREWITWNPRKGQQLDVLRQGPKQVSNANRLLLGLPVGVNHLGKMVIIDVNDTEGLHPL